MKNLAQFAPRVVLLLVITGLLLAGCDQFWIDSADGIAERIITKRQQQAVGTNSDFRPGAEHGDRTPTGDSMYSFTPHPIDNEIPDAFRRTKPPPSTTPTASGPAPASTNGATVDSNGITPLGDRTYTTTNGLPVGSNGLQPLSLSDALRYAFHHAWDFQTQKEELYLSALSLMTERQLWTPQVVHEIQTQYANYGQVRDFDQAMTAVSDLSVSQRLPYGGEVAARLVNTLMRDILAHTTSGETGQAILEANIPLLKGAGKVAFETRYQAERDLIYAVRRFERNRHLLVVDVAGDFFSLLATKAEIESAKLALISATEDQQRTLAQVNKGRLTNVEGGRAETQMLRSRNELINAQVRYQNTLDRFKIRIGMPTTEPIDAVEEQLAVSEPDIEQDEAIETALKYRLDLLNTLDGVDDARRGVRIAQNNFLPQLDLSGRATMSTDPNQKNSMSYNTERTLWQAFVNLEVPIDRREERNVFRASLIELRRAERAFTQQQDVVQADVRDALRLLATARESIRIQEANIRVNETRESQARALLDAGWLSSTIDLFDAQTDLQRSRNDYADAIAQYRLSILQLLLQTGVLRVDDDGHLRN
jgi:outer membrane protein TolC